LLDFHLARGCNREVTAAVCISRPLVEACRASDTWSYADPPVRTKLSKHFKREPQWETGRYRFIRFGFCCCYRFRWPGPRTPTQIRKLGIKCQNGEQSACAQLAKIAKTDKHPELRRLAVLKLTDQTVLAGIAKTDEYWAARQAATERITDQAVLTDIAKTDAEFKVRQAAISKLADKKVIGGIAKTDQDSRVRQAAVASSQSRRCWPRSPRRTWMRKCAEPRY